MRNLSYYRQQQECNTAPEVQALAKAAFQNGSASFRTTRREANAQAAGPVEENNEVDTAQLLFELAQAVFRDSDDCTVRSYPNDAH
eukprot:7385300-Pyramimonas_sp.AAC.1